MNLLFFSATAIAAGLTTFAVGRRGRVLGCHPYCRRCGFDLVGLPCDSRVCSECGANLAARRAVRIGRRRPRAGAITLGLLLLLLGTGLFGQQSGQRAMASGWERQKPQWWLLQEARMPAHRGPAISELLRRNELQQLSPRTTNGTAKILVSLFPDRTVKWQREWGDFIYDAQQKRMVDASTWKQFVWLMVQSTIRFTVDPIAQRGQPLHIEFETDRLRALTKLEIMAPGKLQLAVDDHPLSETTRGYGPPGSVFLSLDTFNVGHHIDDWYVSSIQPPLSALADGDHQLVLTMHLTATVREESAQRYSEQSVIPVDVSVQRQFTLVRSSS